MAAAGPCAMVIFGASGDLAKLKLVPAMYELAIEGLLTDQFVLIGYARTGMTDEEFRKICSESITKNARTAKISSESKRDEVAERVAIAYLDADRAARLARVATKQVDALTQVLESIKVRVGEGRATGFVTKCKG